MRITMKKSIAIVLTILMAASLFVMPVWADDDASPAEPVCFYFETDPALESWTWEDHDGDGYNWQWKYNTNIACPEGQGCMNSQSYVNYVGALFPDNWLISPEVPGGGTLSFMLCAQDGGYPDEHIGVYASIDDGETWSEELGYFAPRAPGPNFTFTVSLADYADQVIKLAFRHYNSTDAFSVNLDAVEVSGGGALPIHTVTFMDSVTGEEIEGAYTVEAGTVLDPEDFPIPPEHEGFEFTGWDYGGHAIYADIVITANYRDSNMIGYYFETDPELEGWTWEDRDGDGYNWMWINGAEPYYADWGFPEGQGCMASFSYDNYTWSALTPDNWLISPVVPGGGTLSFMLRAQEGYYDYENIGVYASINGGVDWSEELGYFAPRAPGPVFTFTVDLAEYADRGIKLAFRHYDSTDQFSVSLDAVEISGGGELPIHTVTFIDGVTGNEIPGGYSVAAGTVPNPEDFPEPPEHKGYCFNCWDYNLDYSAGEVYEDIVIIAQYDVEISFCDWNGVPIYTELIPYYDRNGVEIYPPDAPEHNGYEFMGWDPEFTDSYHYYWNGPKTYTAQYEFNHPEDPDIIFKTNTVYTEEPYDTVTIDFMLDALKPYECHAFTGFLYYEPSELTLVGNELTKGDIWLQIEELGGMVVVDTSVPGRIGLTVIMPNEGFTAEGTIFSMNFHVENYHDWRGYTSPLFIEIAKCVNCPGDEVTPIVYDIENGSVNIYDMTFGDVNWDGRIDTTDVILIMRCALGVQTLTGKYFAAADFNHDGIVNATDALLLMRYIMNLG